MDLKAILSRVKVVPVCVLENTDNALKTAELLLKNGVDVIEITLRTVKAFECIEAVSREFSEMITGAGSVFDGDSLKHAVDSGAQFGVSPCLDDETLITAENIAIPFMPGVSTPSELFRAMKSSRIIKVFPAGALGGIEYIKSAVAPFRMFDFGLVPTGGVDSTNFRDYLSQEKVLACGMTYPVNEKLINEKKFDLIEQRIKEIYEGISQIG